MQKFSSVIFLLTYRKKINLKGKFRNLCHSNFQTKNKLNIKKSAYFRNNSSSVNINLNFFI